jgi:hypothetical protein
MSRYCYSCLEHRDSWFDNHFTYNAELYCASCISDFVTMDEIEAALPSIPLEPQAVARMRLTTLHPFGTALGQAVVQGLSLAPTIPSKIEDAYQAVVSDSSAIGFRLVLAFGTGRVNVARLSICSADK